MPTLKISDEDRQKIDEVHGGPGSCEKMFQYICQRMGIKCPEVEVVLVEKLKSGGRGKNKVEFQGYWNTTRKGCRIRIVEKNLWFYSGIVQMLLHELQHQKQYEDGTLYDWRGKCYWMGEEYSVEYKDKDAYNALPWEKEARFTQFYYLNEILAFLNMSLRKQEDIERFLNEEMGDSWVV